MVLIFLKEIECGVEVILVSDDVVDVGIIFDHGFEFLFHEEVDLRIGEAASEAADYGGSEHDISDGREADDEDSGEGFCNFIFSQG